jgi:hypothetical protein
MDPRDARTRVLIRSASGFRPQVHQGQAYASFP